jgi:hypothetical protein
MKPGKVVAVIVAAVIAGVVSAQQQDFPILKGPYLGQTLPGISPQLFAPEVLSRSKPEWVFCGIFSPDLQEFYYSSFDTGQGVEQIMWMKKSGNAWTNPTPAPFNSGQNDNDSRISPDGNTLFFRSRRPFPGNNDPEERAYTWYVKRTATGWGEPQPLLIGGAPRRIGYLGVASNGNLYFSYRGEDSNENSNIHVSRYRDGGYSMPIVLGPNVNSRYSEGDVFVAPDESFLIVTVWGHPQGKGESDLYISTRNQDGTWGKVRRLGAAINTPANEGCPAVTPDGKYFFYFSVDLRGEAPRGSTYWVDVKSLDDL